MGREERKDRCAIRDESFSVRCDCIPRFGDMKNLQEALRKIDSVVENKNRRAWKGNAFVMRQSGFDTFDKTRVQFSRL